MFCGVVLFLFLFLEVDLIELLFILVSEMDIDKLKNEAHIRWLKPREIFFILRNHDKYTVSETVPKTPPSKHTHFGYFVCFY